MGKKIKEYFKGKNPYLMASAAIVIVSMMVICMILKDEMSAVQETDTVSEVVVETQESEMLEELEQESEVASSVSDSEPVSMVETQTLPTEPAQSIPEPQNTSVPESTIPKLTPTPERGTTPVPERVTEPEETVPPEVVPDTQPEDAVPQEPDTPEPEVIPEPEETPAPEEIPEPEAPHEHSWIFESYFQTPDCSNGGLENQICVHCGETRTVGGTPTGEHDYVVENVGDCCSEEIVRCSQCNAREVRDKDMSNHIDVEDGMCYGCGQKVASESCLRN